VTRIVQLTDCHVSADDGALYRGINPRRSLEALLTEVKTFSPDLVIATGDLAEDASAVAYTWLAGVLAELGRPVLALPGNHDDPALLQAHFTATTVDSPLAVKQGGWQLVLLNSAVENEVPGGLTPRQLEQLDGVLASSGLPTLVALHHQPLAVGSLWIDRYPLLEPEPFWKVLSRHPSVRLVTWGHIHHAVALEREGISALGSPSTVSNSLPGQDKFTHDPAGPACRWFELERDGRFATGLLYGPDQ